MPHRRSCHERRARARRPILALLGLALIAVGCSGTGQQAGSPSADPSSPTSASTGSPAPSTADPTRTPEPKPISIAFAGDTHFEAQLRSRLDDPATALEPIADELAAADLTVLNLETAVGTSGTPDPDMRYNFRASPAVFNALRAAGVDVATMANNHALDYGMPSLRDTFDAAARVAQASPPLDVVGVGADAEAAFAPAVRDVRGRSVAVLAAHTADDPTADPTGHWAATPERAGVAITGDSGRLLEAVTAAETEADVVVVYLHWGIQGDGCPSPAQRDLARSLAAAGADVVVGSHPHRLQGAGMLDGTYVAYSLGNFVWYTRNSEAATRTGVLTVTVGVDGVTEQSWAPAVIQESGLPSFAEGSAAAQMSAERDQLRECTNLQPL